MTPKTIGQGEKYKPIFKYRSSILVYIRYIYRHTYVCVYMYIHTHTHTHIYGHGEPNITINIHRANTAFLGTKNLLVYVETQERFFL